MDEINEEDGMTMEEVEILPDEVVIPRSRPMGRRASSRRLMRNSVTRMSSRSLLQSHMTKPPPPPQQPPMEGDTPKRSSSSDGKEFNKPRRSRQPSWVQELLAQGVSQEDLAAMMGGDPDAMDGEEGDEAHHGHGGANDELVAEQHRYMALIEARKRVQERLGRNPDEPASIKPPAPTVTRSRPCPLPTLKAPRWTPTTTHQSFPYSIPPKEIPIYSERAFLRPTIPRHPELQKGEAGKTAGPGQMMVRCLGCPVNLRVSIHATLVVCERCSVVCPATSTRK